LIKSFFTGYFMFSFSRTPAWYRVFVSVSGDYINGCAALTNFVGHRPRSVITLWLGLNSEDRDLLKAAKAKIFSSK